MFDCFGNLNYMGPSGSGQNTKMCNQISVAGNIIGMCEALLYAERSKLTAERINMFSAVEYEQGKDASSISVSSL